MFLFRRHPDHRPADPDNPLQRGHYAKSMDPRRDGCGWAVICCPECGKLATVGINHDVKADGTISPSLVCPYRPCTFHVFARFDEWAKVTGSAESPGA